jgi:uncharacterized protein YbjQ (UPF0145 family)
MEFILVPILLILGLVFGSMAESRHFRSILEREQKHADVLVLNVRQYPSDRVVESSTVATGSVVVAVDYFKMFLSSFRMFFGGEMRSYATLLERARREAVLRMRESAPDADMFINLRFETSDVGGKGPKASPNVEMFAVATALRFRR